MLKPPIPRMGGKSRLRKRIVSMLPEHICYTEPFFGVGWVYFGKEPSKVEVINDIDGELVNLFKMIKFHSEEIQRLIQYEICSRDLFDFYKEIDTNRLTEIQRAIRFIYLVSQSFASKGVSFGYGTTKNPSPHIFNSSSLNCLKERLRNTYIENKSFEDIINRYDRPHTVHFCDPPYFETDGYSTTFGEHEHLLLRDTLASVKGKFILTINDHPTVREWYKGYYLTETQVHYSVAKAKNARGLYKELIITNYVPPSAAI
ncbi:DNA adenine methylase [Alkaliphilus pronyensis]|uniref:site-specific DNA-methyltransferase (adenine-specific) n=1 Tax=Alkaliphilus pronyensis TaxID=1482732 RepID=A0A6I0F9Z2_9FIRM|nr:DNA adenine methylase [Alkaliphilus pronyensis]KAB3535623.1 DNA adenine methylase [Alkaliphilus pronyensis]